MGGKTRNIAFQPFCSHVAKQGRKFLLPFSPKLQSFSVILKHKQLVLDVAARLKRDIFKVHVV